MVDSKQRSTTLKKLARWTPSSSASLSDGQRKPRIPPLSNDAPFVHVHHDKLQQGALYIIKIKQVSLAMFEGWNDDMCCFSILRSEQEPLRWSEARQLPGDFDIYEAFDECGNPPIHLWSRYLRVSVPSNWFSMFEEGKRKQREWSTRQEQMRHSLIQQNQEYCYPPAHESMVDDSQVSNSSAIHNHDIPAYSNTDVSSMHLNNNNTTTSPSIVASTNIIDPNMMNEEDMSTVNDFHQEPSTTASVNNSQSDYSNTRRQMMSPSPSYQSHIVQQPERTSSIMDREQIRRHLAPGQAVLTNRNSSSVVTLDSAINRSFTSPNLAHHRSKEYVTQHTNVPLTSSSPTMTPPLANTTTVSTSVYNYNTEDLTSKLTESSIISTDAVDFPHDSDRFSIRSDVIPTSTESPTTILPSTSSKSRNRPLLKKIIWG